jgi:hypothetical protein
MTAAKPRPPPALGETRAYPVLALRDIVVFPHMINVPSVLNPKLQEQVRSAIGLIEKTADECT